MQKSYVLIFRQGSRKLTAEEQRKRSEEVRAWALQQIQEGRDLDPRVLEGEAKHSAMTPIRQATILL